MFGFFKNLLRKAPESQAEAQSFAEQSPSSVPSASPTTASSFRATPLRKNVGNQNSNGRCVEVSLQKILSGLPLELQPRIRHADVGEATISVPLEKILAQLSRGAVKVSFGELRQAAPGVFTAENDRDRVLVALPLADILSQLNPALITRRRVQRQVEVPADISSPFDPNSPGLMLEEEEATFAAPPSRNVPQRQTSPGPFPPAVARGGLASVPAPPPGAMPTPGTSRISKPAAPAKPATPAATPLANPGPTAKPQVGTARFAPPPVPPAKTAPPAKPSAPSAVPFEPAAPLRLSPVTPLHPAPSVPTPAAATPIPGASVPTPVPAATRTPLRLTRDSNGTQPPAVPSTPAANTTQPAKTPPTSVESILLTMGSLAEGWPDAVRKEILDLNLAEAKVALPAPSVEQALKQGRIAFSWKTIRSWVRPAVPATVSPHDARVLDLPLKVVAPLFLARQREAAKGQHKVSIDEDIPNLFFGFPQAESGIPVAAATARPTDTNYYVWDDSHDTARVDESEVKRPSPGTKFVAKYATPNEVVSRAASLDGVAGALIALPDGLMVANRLPPELNADTLAAFLPQIFGKVSQCTKELRMGELNNLNFTVGNMPWKIFRVNAIFFAAFGREGEPLPTAQLAALAAELDHKPK